MTLIDYTYFQQRLLAIPNLKDSALEQLNDYIPVLEDRYLNIILGVKLKNEFLAGLEEPVIEQRWKDLRDGKQYEVSDRAYQWKGFVNDKKLSPIANYISANLTNDNQFMNTGIGEVRKLAENSVIITPQYRVSAIWNEAVDFNRSLLYFLKEFENTDYDSWCPDYYKAKSLLSYDYNIGL